ncbi:LuxR C-terminal-related transcriptional regulator [Paenibacillus sp. NFR01]|uniref:LuxR C-terminal-related transcriptional regulator n=1 Tax=Paenibacillus sp. NFR01 TaxID=1566279 RepID=UPI0008C2F97E|nr:LuxR C-terminal-related transcriptional regulator [Paenibacillus sp. NFR01]SEU23530.1 PocR sensory domain-containing protein [Paenibacillus sp. NFR01]
MKFLQSLQHAYSSFTGLNIMITDQDDHRLTEPSGRLEIVNLLLGYQQRSTEDSILMILDKVKAIQNPTVYETATGFKLLVAPVKIKKNTVCYILAGVLVDASNIGLIQNMVHQHLPSSEWGAWERSLEEVPGYTRERVEILLERLEELAEFTGVLLEQGRANDKHAHRVQLLNLAHLMDSGDPNWLQGILGIFARVMELEFAGFACNITKEEQFTVLETIGLEGEATLQGASFFVGEGFLGQVGLSRQMGYWERSDRDPRVSFFNQRGIEPRVLICYPIKYQEHFFGLLFGGDSSISGLSEELADMGALLVNHLAASFYSLENEAADERRKMRMKAFEQMAQGVLKVKSVDGFFQMIMDTMQMTLQTSFACMVLINEADEKKTFCASSYPSRADASAYTANVESVYFKEGSTGFGVLHKPVSRMWEGLELLEFPLMIGTKLRGVFGVCMNGQVEYKEEYMPLLNSVNPIVATKLMLGEQERSSAAGAVMLLHQAMQVWQPQAYHKSQKVKELAQDFLKIIGGAHPDVEHIGQAGLLSDYDPEILASWLGDIPVVGLLKDTRRIESGEGYSDGTGISSYSLTAKALFMVLSYFEHGKKEGGLAWPASLEDPIKQAFEDFLASRKEAGTQREPANRERLTPREEEILRLVVQGFNNSEISEKLFISSHTVKNHITKIYEKLGVNSRAQAISKMYRTI